MIVLGLTGSIGMGKSTTAAMFAQEGAFIWNADEAVHRLYAPGGAAVAPIAAAFPAAVIGDAVDRERLVQLLSGDPGSFEKLESIVHPLVAQQRLEDLSRAEAQGVQLAVLDIPLLFETGGEAGVDAVVVVSAPADVQAARVLARPGMTRDRLEVILSRQLADAQKRRRADFVVETGQGLEAARAQVKKIVGTVLSPGWKASGRRLSSSSKPPH
jgi:dephospho-CoA kinase